MLPTALLILLVTFSTIFILSSVRAFEDYYYDDKGLAYTYCNEGNGVFKKSGKLTHLETSTHNRNSELGFNNVVMVAYFIGLLYVLQSIFFNMGVLKFILIVYVMMLFFS